MKGALLATLAACLAACGGVPAQNARAHRAAAGGPRRFVPPFAYEAYVRGELALAAGRPQEAALQLELATAAPEEDAYLLSRLAEAQAQAGDAELAHSTLAEAQRVDACEEELWLTRGRWAERAERLDEATRAYRTALACAPDSAASALALMRALRADGALAQSLALLGEGTHAAARGHLRLYLSHELAQGSVVEARFALESWSSLGALDQALLEEAAAQAIARKLPLLALRLSELGAERLAPLLRAELAKLSSDRHTLQALLAQHHEAAFGGPLGAARVALSARDYERAELYASLPPRTQDGEALRAAKIEALSGLGEHESALSELRALGNTVLRRRLARAALARLGLSALTREVEAREQN